MKVRIVFTSKEVGIRDVTVLNATSVESISEQLKQDGCTILYIGEEKN